MNNRVKIIAGSLAGSVIVGALPLALAQSSSGTTSSAGLFDRFLGSGKELPIPSQECVEALAGMDAAMLSTIDAMTAAHKTALQAHQAALKTAASITDDTQRQEAVKAAHVTMREAMKTFMDSHKDDHQGAMDAVKAVCGDIGPHGFKMMRPGLMGQGGHKGMMFNRMHKEDIEEQEDISQQSTDSL